MFKRTSSILLVLGVSLAISACAVTSSVNDVAFKARVTNSLSNVNLVTNDILLNNLTDAELNVTINAIDNVNSFTAYWADYGGEPLAPSEVTRQYNLLMRSYKTLALVVATHWKDFTRIQHVNFKLLRADLIMLNKSYEVAIRQQSYQEASASAIAIAKLALTLMAV